jgi:hypothetical protein
MCLPIQLSQDMDVESKCTNSFQSSFTIQTYLLNRCPFCNQDSPCVDVNQLSVNSQVICLIENLPAIIYPSSGGGVANDDGDDDDDDDDVMHILMCQDDECGGVCVDLRNTQLI